MWLPENMFIFYPAVQYSPLVGWGELDQSPALETH